MLLQLSPISLDRLAQTRIIITKGHAIKMLMSPKKKGTVCKLPEAFAVPALQRTHVGDSYECPILLHEFLTIAILRSIFTERTTHAQRVPGGVLRARSVGRHRVRQHVRNALFICVDDLFYRSPSYGAFVGKNIELSFLSSLP